MKRSSVHSIFAGGCFALAILAGMTLTSSRVRADKGDNDDRDGNSRVEQGFQIARVQGIQLNLRGKERGLVGLGSYLVNAVGGCNDCHTQPSYTKDPYNIGVVTKQVNTAGYLAGGRPFFGPIVSRNLTPGKSGKPLGDASFSDFLAIMRTGIDLDKWHLSLPTPPNPPGLNGSLLQVMPWSVYQDMTEHDLRAIYVYLSAIPCVEGDPGNPKGADTKGTRCK